MDWSGAAVYSVVAAEYRWMTMIVTIWLVVSYIAVYALVVIIGRFSVKLDQWKRST